MTDNPDYWNTIATVIPVIALTYSTAFKRGDWHRLKVTTRRWTALYGASLVALLVWVETMSLGHLKAQTTSASDESVSFVIVAWVAAQVLAVPIAPLVVIALHDFHPAVLRAKRGLRAAKRDIAEIRKEHDGVITWINQVVAECRIEGMEQVLVSPSLVFDDTGAIRPNYIKNVIQWDLARGFKGSTAESLERIDGKLQAGEKQLKQAQKRLDKALRARTKKTAKLTNLHR